MLALLHDFGRFAGALQAGRHAAAVVEQLDAVAVFLHQVAHDFLVHRDPLGRVLFDLFVGQRELAHRRHAARLACQTFFAHGGRLAGRRQVSEDQGQGHAAQHQREQNRAGGQKDQHAARGEGLAVVQQNRHGQRTGQRHRAANAGEGGGQIQQCRWALGHLAGMVGAAQRTVHAQRDPDPAQQQQRARNGGDVADQNPPFVPGFMQRHADDRGQLQAQQQKDGTVERGFDQAPGACGLQALAHVAAAVEIAEVGRDARSHGGQNAGDADLLAHDVGGKGQQHQQQHHLRGGHVAQTAGDGTARMAESPAEQRADGQTASGHPDEILGDRTPRECAGQRRGNREFQCHQTGRVVEQRLAFEDVHGLVGHAQIARDGRDGDRIGGRDHGGQREGDGQRNLGNHPVDEIAQTEYREHHQTEGQQQDGAGQREELALGNAPTVGEQQRRNEQQHEQFGVEGDVQSGLWPGDGCAERNLNQWKRNGADVAGNNARQRAKHQDKQDGFDGVHMAFSTHMGPRFCQILKKTECPNREKWRNER